MRRSRFSNVDGANGPGQAAAGSETASALGPRGREIFSRLFGSARAKESIDRSRPAAREATAIAIASGKGGTGKSFLSTSLAVLLHRAKRRVTLVDCDYGLACDHLLLGVNPKLTLRHLLAGQARLADIRIETPAGPHLVPGGSGIRQMANLSDQELLTFGKSLAELATSEDVILLDLGAGISPQTILTLTAADHVVLVTQPEIAALTDAYALCKNLTQVRKDAHMHVVVNRVVEPGQGLQAYDKLASVMQKFTGLSLGFLGEIAEDPLVTQRRLGQMPIVATDADSPTTRAVAGILDQLERVAGPLTQRNVVDQRGIEKRFSEHRLFL